MSRVEGSIVIDVPPQTVQQALDKVEAAHEWAPSLQKIWDVQGRGTGCTYKWQFQLGPTSFTGATEIIESTPERFVMQTTGGIPSTWTWLMEPVDAGTRLEVTIDYTVPGSVVGMIVDKLVIERQNKNELTEALNTLKNQLEA